MGIVCSLSCVADILYVAPHGSNQNPGTELEPLKAIQSALDRVNPGEQIVVLPGTYVEALQTRSAGLQTLPISITGMVRGTVIVTSSSDRVLEISHPFYIVENLIFDGQFSKHDVVRVHANGDGLKFRNNIVRNSAKDGIDLGNAATTVSEDFDYLEDVEIEGSTFKNFLAKNILGNRIDAHGIVAGGVRDLKILETTVELVSGDALQLANGNWDRVSVRSVVFRNYPVSEEIASQTGFAEGVNPGENAIDTKQDSDLPVRGRLTVSQSEFYGWAGSLISNAAALNLKEKVDVTVDACTFADNEIALRLRGGSGTANGAHVEVSNNIFYANQKAIRVEDDLDNFRLVHNTFGAKNDEFLELVSGGVGSGFSAINNAFLAKPLPLGISSSANLVLDATQFIDIAANNYRLANSSRAIDTASVLLDYQHDHAGNSRPQGDNADFGALEYLSKKQTLPIASWFQHVGASAVILLGSWKLTKAHGIQ